MVFLIECDAVVMINVSRLMGMVLKVPVRIPVINMMAMITNAMTVLMMGVRTWGYEDRARFSFILYVLGTYENTNDDGWM